ncbi:MAG: polyphosphate kinase 1, partial [Ignavibacteria bacterium]
LIAGARYHNFSDMFNLPHHQTNELEYENLKPIINKDLADNADLFNAIGKKDFLLHFPYQSFGHVVRFFEIASNDEHVTEIKITFYRAAKNSSIVKALLNALANGKKVTVFIEIKARFDEEMNIEYAKELEDAGAVIIYSLPGLKVHAKIALVVKKENGSFKNYCYLSTGNFNEKTSMIYTDFGYFTSDDKITNEVADLFLYLQNDLKKPEFKNILVAQFNMKKAFIELIDSEIEYANENKNASIFIKLNSLEDRKIIEKLYDAGKAGVKIKIIVRGVCCLIPGVKNMSENIEVISIVDRYLEHSRVYIFHNKGDEKIYLSSADLMKRNLNRRIEVAFPVYDVNIKMQIKDLMEIQMNDNTKARIIDKDQINNYKNNSAIKLCAQEETYEYLKKM